MREPAYRYDTQGRLILARPLQQHPLPQAGEGWGEGLGTPYGYQANGLAFTDTITHNFGAAVSWNSSATANLWQGDLPD